MIQRNQIKTILKKFETYAHKNLDPDKSERWTKKITHLLYDKGIKCNFEAYSKYPDHGGEWVFDLCWVERCNGITKSLPLAMECEWNSWQEVKDDFEKLLWSRAELCVMIFESRDRRRNAGFAKEKANERIDNLIGCIKAFSAPEPDTNYLFCVWCDDKGNDKGEFVFRRYPTEEN